jgi:hypothetical protein
MMTGPLDEGGQFYDATGTVQPQASGVMRVNTGGSSRAVLATTSDAGKPEPLLIRQGFQTRFARPLELKVKYRSHDEPVAQEERDMYTEVAATRLLWALGFAADRMYRPRSVHCHRCPGNPFVDRNALDPGRYTTFDEAAIELRYMGDRAETYEALFDGGWSWGEELHTLRYGTGPGVFDEEQKTQLDGLVVLLNILGHVSSLPEQNRLVCIRRGMQQIGTTAKYCPQTRLLVHDLGSVFNKKDENSLEAWTERPIWSDRARCVPAIWFRVPEGEPLRPYIIGEPGRRFIVGLLDQLSDEHLRAVFESAAFERYDITLVAPSEIPTPAEAKSIIDAWIAAFRRKIDEVRSVTCEAA